MFSTHTQNVHSVEPRPAVHSHELVQRLHIAVNLLHLSLQPVHTLLYGKTRDAGFLSTSILSLASQRTRQSTIQQS